MKKHILILLLLASCNTRTIFSDHPLFKELRALKNPKLFTPRLLPRRYSHSRQDIVDKEGNTLLHVTVSVRENPDRFEMVQNFIVRGININAINNHGLTALDIAKPNTNVYKILVKHGAKRAHDLDQ